MPSNPIRKREGDPWDPELVPIVDWIRKALPSKESVQLGKRVEYFRGPKLLDALMKSKKLEFESTADAAKYAQRLMDAGFFHRAQRIKTETRIQLEPHPDFRRFADEGVYTWLYEGSKKTQTIFSFVAVALVGMVCMIRIWPLWLKIAVYYISLTLLILQVSLFSLRIVLYCLFWIVGFKDIWLLPDLLNDDVEFLAAFKPLFGKGTPPVKRDLYDRPIGPVPTPPEDDGTTWNFGLINLVAILAISVGAMWYMGVFDPDHIPEFVVTQHELWESFPALAPPNITETIVETAEAAAEAAGEAAADAAA